MDDSYSPPSGDRSRRAAVALVAATYFYFLIFSEFAFLALADARVGGGANLRSVMFVLGMAGIAGALSAAAGFRRRRAASMLAWALRGCAAGGVIALLAANRAGLMTAAAVGGAGLGAATVVLATMLRDAVGPACVGRAIGIGTGMAYALCNLPWIFRAAPATQTLLAVLAVGGASFAPGLLSVNGYSTGARWIGGARDPVRWTAILLALVWLDSAAFYIVQHTPALRGATWGGTGGLLGNASIHFVAAVIAGIVLDRGARELVAGVALASLALAGLSLNGLLPMEGAAGWFYTAGVSLYSVVLVEFPARTARPAIAALVFAVAGWAGSALGIGMAQDLHRIPAGFIGAAAGLAGVALAWRWRALRAAAVLLAVLGVTDANEVNVGRSVYIAEGCIHCHSQYIRPRVASEVLNWGPAMPLSEALVAAPPLFGTRRQGPDLSHVGNRRSAEWNRLHLMEPQAVSPGSRMPSYAHLFRRGDERGPALLAYLASLGSDSIERREQEVTVWKPVSAEAVSPAAASRLFQRLCVPCHGASGRGDGRLAPALSLRPPDWPAEPWRRIPDGQEVETALSRVIKFGLPGSPMAGHEYLADPEIVGLARFVLSLHKAGGSGSSAAVQP